ncbi:hypothetical protein DNTS_017153 [Danionella cerebrum]|uniref:Cadherin domain-containing protein n=1 Tax=Danionella cerebrum TaxID=2873325 RepID=A0A553NGA1_9TELE|nr:hypothetical protein DNTS_017153 [Danionella translucida]
MALISILFIFACLGAQSVRNAFAKEINCQTGKDDGGLGSFTEGYEGDVEVITNIRAEDRLKLESYLFEIGVSFLEFDYTEGELTATVRTTKPLNADVLKQYGQNLYYSVTCVNTGMKNTRSIVVEDINNNPPIFESKTYSKSISETTAVDSNVLRVNAEDADASLENSRITYSIQPPAPEEFEVRNDGNIRLKKRLNYNTASQHVFTVEAKDIGDLSDTTTVTITIDDYDNLNPYFHHTLYKASIKENQEGLLSEISPDAIKAQDGDKGINEPVVYSITAVLPNEYQSSFVMDANSGVVSVTSALDREEIELITLYLQAVQQDDTSKMANAVVSVTIEDVDDNPPKFDQDEYSVSIPENSAQDQFGGFEGTLRIIPESVPFSISTDGRILVKNSAELDRESTTNFNFQNDNSPQFTSSVYEGKVNSDQTAGMEVIKVEAKDLDEGPNGEISYYIEFGNEKGFFAIDEKEGTVTLVNIIPLVEKEILEFALYVTARDGGTISRSTSAMVHIKAPGDLHPQFLQKTYRGQVEENQSDADIVKVDILVIDPIVAVLNVESEMDKFSINQETGYLSTKGKLDFEEKSSYTVLLSISDGTSRDEASVLVEVLDVNDNSPVFEDPPRMISVEEESTARDNILTLKATDLDAGFNGEVRYTLLGGAGMFSIDQESGVLTSVAPLDRETEAMYSLEITAQDQGRPSLSTKTDLDITVTDINDNAPIFSQQQYETKVSEDGEVGAHVLDVLATDKDEGLNAAVSYSIVRQDPLLDDLVFTIDPETGSIKLAGKLDYAQAKRFTLYVEGQDGGSPSLTGSAVVIVWVEDVNDKAPVFTKEKYDVSVYENLAAETELVFLVVTDEDEDGFSKGSFIMDSDTFVINSEGVVSLKSDATLDRETKENYVLQVIAVDQPLDGLSSTAQLSITLLDINDNNPQFLPLPESIEIQEGKYSEVAPGEVCEVLATDADIGDNGRVGISTSSYSSIFQFRDDGTLLAISELDRETQDVYDVVVVAVDHGIPQLNNVITVKVSITDANDNTPVFSSDSYSRSILVKDAKIGELLLTISATDKDTGDNARITYSFAESSSMVALDPETGDITVTSDLSEVTEDTLLDLAAIATDHGEPALSDEAKVLIHLKTSSLTESVVFESSSYNFAIKENEPESSLIGQVKALTGSSVVTVSYNMKSHEGIFSVDAEGRIKAIKTLNKEDVEWYIFTVEAVDSRTPPNTAETTVSVQVEDVNETPMFDAEKYDAEIFSLAPYKFPIVKVQASDPDVGESSFLRYSLSEETSLLDVEESTGKLYVLDASSTSLPVVTCQVKATDPHGLFAIVPVEISVKQSARENVVVISLNQPVFSVEKQVPKIEDSMTAVLGWSVKVLHVGTDGGSTARESTAKSSVSFIAVDSSGAVIEAKQVKEKLRGKYEDLTVELKKLFGSDLEITVEEPSGDLDDFDDSNDVVIITLGVLLGLTLVGFITILTIYIVRVKKMSKDNESDRQNFSISNQYHNFEEIFHFSNKQENKEVTIVTPQNTETNLSSENRISAL